MVPPLAPPLTASEVEEQGGLVLNVAVEASWRRRGVGRLLLEGAREHAHRAWGLQWLYCQVDEGNEAARALYAEMGYEVEMVRGGGPGGDKRLLLRARLGGVSSSPGEKRGAGEGQGPSQGPGPQKVIG